jgi:Fanconi-associated nuclease 1
LGILKEYEYEAEVINALLRQRVWRRGSRARWYERRAVLMTRYLCLDKDGRKKENVLREAMRGIVEALKDEDTGIGEYYLPPFELIVINND